MVDCPGPCLCFHCTNQMESRSGNSLLKWRRVREGMTDTGRAKEGERKKDGERLVDALENMIRDPERKIL